MKISSKGRYAVRVMAELARNKNDFVSVAYLSEKQEISVKYLEKILSLLVKANLIESLRGVQGGYKLNREPKDYSVTEILKVTDDLPKLVPCINSKSPCPMASKCDSISCWEHLSMLITNYLSQVTLEDLLNKKV